MASTSVLATLQLAERKGFIPKVKKKDRKSGRSHGNNSKSAAQRDM